MNFKPLAVLALVVLLAGLTGCVERCITIGSNPSGALVLLNDQEIGRTPVTVPFTWYGDYDVRLRFEENVGTPERPVIKRYYLHTHKRTVVPAHEVMPLDLFAELLPVTFKDEQVWAFVVPEVKEPTDPEEIKKSDKELIDRANQLKSQMGGK